MIYDPAVLRFEEGEEGTFIAGAGQTAFFAAPTSSAGEVVIGLSRLGRGPGADGNGELCVLHCEVIGPGDSGLAFRRAKVRDSANRIVPSVFETASLTGR